MNRNDYENYITLLWYALIFCLCYIFLGWPKEVDAAQGFVRCFDEGGSVTAQYHGSLIYMPEYFTVKNEHGIDVLSYKNCLIREDY